MSNTPKITQMDNDSTYFAMLTRSSGSNDQDGSLDNGAWYAAGTFSVSTGDKHIPQNDIELIGTIAGTFKIYSEQASDGSWSVHIHDANGDINGTTPYKGYANNQELNLEIAQDGTPSMNPPNG